MADPPLRSGSTIRDGASEASGCQVGFIVRCSEQGPASPVMVLYMRLDRCSPRLDAERERGRMPGLRRGRRAHVDTGSECLAPPSA